MSFAHRRSALLALLVAAIVLVSAGAAAAVSGGGYSQDQQDCANNASAWNTPPFYDQHGCHDFAVNLETGGTHNGDANSNNTRFGEFGIDESPNVSNNPSFGAEFNIGDPGTPASPHSGCLAANTDGTNGGTGVGCGNNPNGAGFSAVWDYYDVYCPATANIPLNSIPIPDGVPALKNCDSTQPVGNSKFTPDTGSQQKLDQIATQGLLLYLGANDGLDNGEHDGFSGNTCQAPPPPPPVKGGKKKQPPPPPPPPCNPSDGAVNGPSDGGAVTLSLTPQNAGNTPSATHPEGLANFSFGACADGICFGASTQQQTVYQGCNADNLSGQAAADDTCAPGTAQNDDVFHNDTPASTKESPNCNGGGADTDLTCLKNADGSPNPGGANAYRQSTPHNMNVEPGVQTYQDPDPNRSPAAPIGTPGIYVGTCGVYVNDSNHTVGNGITGQNPGYIVPNQCG
ncbi:MAG: hypothetical protein JO155_04500 [Acidimicrobiia bacterium]|nr:hypothetical protein [Acidimicrobiia bacterium]